MKRPEDDLFDHDVMREMLEAISPVSPPPGVRDKLLARARNAKLLTIRADGGDWRVLASGVEIKVLYEDAKTNAKSCLIRMQPGATLPPHEHHAPEECLVLEGEVCIGALIIRAGDYHLAPTGMWHDKVICRRGALMFLRGIQ